ncbi:ribonuclease HI family protein [bacterium]|nr:ribonuclease HI family protein [bacterium]
MVLFCDGASRGNPGPGSFGYAIFEGEQTIAREGRTLGTVTNNVAEYEGVIQGLARCQELGATEVTVKSDSQVLVRQLNGEYKIKAPHLQTLAQKARELSRGFEKVSFIHIPREENSLADKLANAALDGRVV